MTREDAKLWMNQLFIHNPAVVIEGEFVDKIFDDFESEVCSHCAFSLDANDDEGELIYCDEIGIEMSKTFGCVYFQEKEKK